MVSPGGKAHHSNGYCPIDLEGPQKEILMNDAKPVDHPNRETVKVRQGTGPRIGDGAFISLLASAAAGVALVAYFFFR